MGEKPLSEEVEKRCSSFLWKDFWVVLITNHSGSLLLYPRGTSVPHFCHLSLNGITWIQSSTALRLLLSLIAGIAAKLLLKRWCSVFISFLVKMIARATPDRAGRWCLRRWGRAVEEASILVVHMFKFYPVVFVGKQLFGISFSYGNPRKQKPVWRCSNVYEKVQHFSFYD